MEDGQFPIKVNGKDYAFPPSGLTIGEMCDAEQFFGVDFNKPGQSGFRLTAALLWIAIKRDDPSVTIDDIRDLPPEIFQQLEGDASPPAETESQNGSISESSTVNSDASAPDPSLSGNPGSDTTSPYAPLTSAT